MDEVKATHLKDYHHGFFGARKNVGKSVRQVQHWAIWFL
jgi:hypothetical protein